MSYRELAAIIEKSNRLVFFGGAGVSTECGIPDFRGQEGLYNRPSQYPPEEILSHTFFERHPDIFYDFLRENLLKYRVSPNKGHRALAELERMGKLTAVITQNIDNLHQVAGSQNVLELHGTLSRFYCPCCAEKFTLDWVNSRNGVPKCHCGGVVRPDIVLYEEPLDDRIWQAAMQALAEADTLIVAGTSLTVYPATGLLRCFKGDRVVIINRDETGFDQSADLVIRQPFGKTMMKTMIELGAWQPGVTMVAPELDGFVFHPSFPGIEICPVLAEEQGWGIRSQLAKIHPGAEIPPHTHEGVEVFSIIQGSAQVLIDGDWIQANPGTALVASPGTTHAVRNSGKEDVLLFANFSC